jgi:hypothetical protein
MNLTFIPLLAVQRELYQQPRTMERFHSYLHTMLNEEKNDLELPLTEINPMSKDHLLPFVEQLVALDAEGIAAEAVQQVQANTASVPGDFRVSLIVVDDAQGGWTNRYTKEYNYRQLPILLRPRVWPQPWITVWFWTSQAYMAEQVRCEVLTCLYRVVYLQQHGPARTLAEWLAQEGYAMQRGGATSPTLDAEDLAYTRQVLEPLLNASDQPTILAALFGDQAARDLGYQLLGLSPYAGLALARQLALGPARPFSEN